MIIGKTFTFDAAHYLPGHARCGQTHGHTWKVTVEVEGPVGEKGMVMDLNDLSGQVVKYLVDMDHRSLNLRFVNPTCEVIAKDLHRYISSLLTPPLNVHSVKVQEGEGGYARTQI